MAKKKTTSRSTALVSREASAAALVAAGTADASTEVMGPNVHGALMDVKKLRSVGKLEVVKVLTFQLIKFPVTATLLVTLMSEIWKGDKILNASGDEAKKDPPHLIRAVPYIIGEDDGLATDGVVRELIVPAVLKAALERQYPGHHTVKSLAALKVKDPHDHFGEAFAAGEVPAYYGRSLLIKSYPKREGKQYRTFDIAEVNIG